MNGQPMILSDIKFVPSSFSAICETKEGRRLAVKTDPLANKLKE